MMDMHSHLTEEERQSLADGSAPSDRARILDAHLAECDDCAADVARLRTLMARLSNDTSSEREPELETLWPSIRSRIEQTKVVPLAGAPAIAAPRKRSFTRRHLGIVAGLVAASALLAVLFKPSRTIPVDVVETPASGALMPVSDSVRSYEDEARALLNRLELQRSMLRPEARASLDRDLKVIDQAIDELKLAIASDPRNPALRQLLASSYRQKIELLKRASNAG